jgi:hypothetical protein
MNRRKNCPPMSVPPSHYSDRLNADGLTRRPQMNLLRSGRTWRIPLVTPDSQVLHLSSVTRPAGLPTVGLKLYQSLVPPPTKIRCLWNRCDLSVDPGRSESTSPPPYKSRTQEHNHRRLDLTTSMSPDGSQHPRDAGIRRGQASCYFTSR